MTKREKKMLFLLGWTILLSLFWYIRTGLIADIRHLGSTIAQKELQIDKTRSSLNNKEGILQDINALDRALENLQGNLNDSAYINSYDFGLYVRDLLRSENININRYQMLDEGVTGSVEFHVRGSSFDFLKFLYSFSTSSGMHHMDFLSIRKERGNDLNIVMRTGYVGMDE